MTKNTSKNTPQPRDVNAAQRVSTALKLRAAKLTYQEIARQCGYSTPSSARVAIMRELERTITKDVEELRAQELDMLDRLHRECWLLAMDRENKGRLFAVDRVLSIAKRRAELLNLDISPKDDGTSSIVVVRQLPAGYMSAEVAKMVSDKTAALQQEITKDE